MATRRAHHPRQGFTASRFPANMTVESSHPRFARPERRRQAEHTWRRSGRAPHDVNGVDLDDAPTLDHGNIDRGYSGFAGVRSGSILAIKLSGTGSITGQGTVLTITLWCKTGIGVKRLGYDASPQWLHSISGTARCCTPRAPGPAATAHRHYITSVICRKAIHDAVSTRPDTDLRGHVPHAPRHR